MSRVGLQPVTIPKGVTVALGDDGIMVNGDKGKLTQSYLPFVDFIIKDSDVLVTRNGESKKARAMHGLFRSLLNNMVLGVSQGFTKILLINGVGYRAEMKKDVLFLNLGYSNPVEYIVPAGVQINVDGGNKITVSGIEKALVGQVAAEIRRIRPPEPYKGKGVRYDNENVRRKVGKSGVK